MAPPLALMSIAPFAIKLGAEVKIYDANYQDNFIEILNNFKPDIVGISTLTGPMLVSAVELSKKSKEAQAALATRDRSRMRVLASQEKQIQAEIRLVERLIERGQLVSPVEGVIIAANPSHSFGSPVERGEVLFEIAPLTNFDLIIDVDERDIADISEGDTGQLVLTARPQEPLPFSVKKVVPVSASEDGATTFRVEAELHDQPAWIRPGMSGISKIGVDERKLLWIWTHRIIEEIEMRWWRWGLL